MNDLALLDEMLGLKALPRAGWGCAGARSSESVAAHSWGVAWLVLALCPEHLDRGRALAYATMHDAAEVRAGDLTPGDCTPEEKQAREESAADGLFALRPDLRQLWAAYEAQADEESRFVRQLDRLDMALQAVRYQREQGVDPRPFLASARKVVRDARLVGLLDALDQAANA